MYKKYHGREEGFTLVELLIVIVVIAILAAISIIAYNGVQDRAKTSAGQSLAREIENKTQLYFVAETTYPSQQNDFADVDASRLDEDIKPFAATADTLDETTADNGNVIAYVPCTNPGTDPATTDDTVTGVRIFYWSYTDEAPVMQAQLGTITDTDC